MKRISRMGIAVLSMALLTAPTFAKNENLSDKDIEVLKKMNEGSIAEVQMGGLAQKKGTNREIKEFGKKLVKDHELLKDQVQQLATKSGITLPAGTDAEEKPMHTDLVKRSGADFDRKFIEGMLED